MDFNPKEIDTNSSFKLKDWGDTQGAKNKKARHRARVLAKMYFNKWKTCFVDEGDEKLVVLLTKMVMYDYFDKKLTAKESMDLIEQFMFYRFCAGTLRLTTYFENIK
jgi:hypothetical protein